MLQQTNSGHEPDTAALVSMASVVPVVNTAAPRSTVDAFIARIETLLKTVVATIQDQKLSGKAVAAIVTQIEDIVASDQEAASNMTLEQQKDLVRKLACYVYKQLLPYVDDAGAVALAALTAASGSLFEFVRDLFLQGFDLNNDGKVSSEECAAVCGSCCFPMRPAKPPQ